MSKIPAILSATLTVTLAACADDHTPLGQPMTVPLVTSESVQVGTLTVFNSTDGLFITADAAIGYKLTGSRLAVAKSLSGIPMTQAKNPVVGHFLLKKVCQSPAAQIQFALPLLVEPGTQLFIALRAEVRPDGSPDDDRECDDHRTQTAWPLGTPFGGCDGAMYVTYTVQSASVPSLAGQYRTHSQEAWGSDQVNDATTYLTGNYSRVFPTGATVGTKMGFTAHFSNSTAVMTFLPQAGMPASLMRNFMNPLDLANPLAGNTLALTLNAGFSTDLAFCPTAAVAFTDLVVADPGSRFYGVAVKDLLGMANDLLGGLGQDLNVTMDEMNEALTKVNANFESQDDLHFLGLP
jgi:hypothetical protein